jgi:hypothetical protein
MKKPAFVKMYNWKDLARLVVADMQRQHNITITPDSDFHYIGGMDTQNNPFVRVDLTPLEAVTKE